MGQKGRGGQKQENVGHRSSKKEIPSLALACWYVLVLIVSRGAFRYFIYHPRVPQKERVGKEKGGEEVIRLNFLSSPRDYLVWIGAPSFQNGPPASRSPDFCENCRPYKHQIHVEVHS